MFQLSIRLFLNSTNKQRATGKNDTSQQEHPRHGFANQWEDGKAGNGSNDLRQADAAVEQSQICPFMLTSQRSRQQGKWNRVH